MSELGDGRVGLLEHELSAWLMSRPRIGQRGHETEAARSAMGPEKMNPGTRVAAGARNAVIAGELDGPEHTPPKRPKATGYRAKRGCHSANPWAGWSHAAVRSAERRGLILRPETCENCGTVAKLDAHHEDHRDPLRVVFWCRRCHRQHHAAGRRAAD